jgi:hypothetical protein
MAVTYRCFAFHHSSFNHSLLKHHENISYRCEDKHTLTASTQKVTICIKVTILVQLRHVTV